MKVAVGSQLHRANACHRLALSRAVPPVMCLIAGAAWGLEAQPVALAQAQMEIFATTLSRLDNFDGSPASTRIGLTWLPPRRSALGLSLGVNNPGGSVSAVAASLAGSAAPSLDLGLHWRYTLGSEERVDVTAWRRMTPIDAASLVQSREPSYGARVELRLTPVTRTGLVAERGFLGFQMEGGGRITIRRSGGKPMVYYRTKF
jgi:hypothetical protein